MEPEVIVRAYCPGCEEVNYLHCGPLLEYDTPGCEAVRCHACHEKFRLDGSDGPLRGLAWERGLPAIED